MGVIPTFVFVWFCIRGYFSDWSCLGCRKGQSYRSIIGYRSDNITTKDAPYFSGRLATCYSPALEVTSHTLFEEGDVMGICRLKTTGAAMHPLFF
jgi:hypothetical protein